MTWSVVWTLLPNGFEPLAPVRPHHPRRARLSLVASLRNAGPGTTLGASPLARWPTFVAGLGRRRGRQRRQRVQQAAAGHGGQPGPGSGPVEPALRGHHSGGRLQAGRPHPDQHRRREPGHRPAGALRLETSHAHGAAARALADLYAEALRSSPHRGPRGSPRGPGHRRGGAWAAPRWRQPPRRAGRPGRGTSESDRGGRPGGAAAPGERPARPGEPHHRQVEQAAALLRQQGQPDAAAAPWPRCCAGLRLSGKPPPRRPPAATVRPTAPPTAPLARATRGTGGTGTPRALRGPGTAPSLLANIRPAEQADFHQVVGLMLDHPTLSLRLGLRVDLTIEAFDGRPASASPVQAGSPRRGRCRWSSPSARAEPAPAGVERFVMATQPLEVNEVVNGMLDLRSSTTLTPAGWWSASWTWWA